jgi:hypothetical protein
MLPNNTGAGAVGPAMLCYAMLKTKKYKNTKTMMLKRQAKNISKKRT